MSKTVGELLSETLEFFWGYKSFRGQQEDIINTVLQQNDAVALLPTGAGKSLCYQLPALVLEGTCLVVSPLIALMKDQVSQLKNRGIEAELLSAELEDFEAEEIYSRCEEGITKLLYISPERLQNAEFIRRSELMHFSFLAVDEAHCISEWGQDFRPSYQNISSFRSVFNTIPCLALTATATPKVLADIRQKLSLKSPKVFRDSFRRTNLQLFVNEINDKYQRIYDMLKRSHSSGIIYTRTRKEAEQLTSFLQSKNISRVNYFHAALPPREKNLRQQQWLTGEGEVLVATNAFGMGIDKENVRFVVHFSPPASLENYYQEIGRAGRDGEESFTYMLWNQQELSHFDDILRNQIPSKQQFLSVISYLYSVNQIAENELRENAVEVKFEGIQRFTGLSMAKIKNILQFLHHQEIIYLKQHQSLSSLELLMKPSEIETLHSKDAYFLEMLLRNITGFGSYRTQFSEAVFSQKMKVPLPMFKDKLQEAKKKGYIEYLDGSQATVRFLIPRDERSFSGKWWNVFEQIQKNKIQKWEEIKFFLKENSHCRMKLILSYFGESHPKDCGKCDVCKAKTKSLGGKNFTTKILHELECQPLTLDELAIQLNYFNKEKLLENLIFLLDLGKLKMYNYKTYMLKDS